MAWTVPYYVILLNIRENNQWHLGESRTASEGNRLSMAMTICERWHNTRGQMIEKSQ